MSTNRQSGFSLIEMIVSLGVFSIVVTTAVGALLVVIATNQQLQAEQTVMTNLSFALDSMTREMRMGSSFFCGSVNNTNTPVNGGATKIFQATNDDLKNLDKDETLDCPDGRTPTTNKFQGVAFIEGGDSVTGDTSVNHRILYYFNTTEKKIYRRVDDEQPQSIVSSGLEIVDAQFYVTGSETIRSDNTKFEQPTITIYLEAKEKDVATSKSYHLQTTVTQRTLDI